MLRWSTFKSLISINCFARFTRTRDSQRLDKFLSHQGLGTRDRVKKLLREGKVTIDGEVCLSGAQHIRPGVSVVAWKGKPITEKPKEKHILLYKPLGYSCSNSERESPIITELLPLALRRYNLQAAGRLDRDTSGLLVMTSDGKLLHTWMHPRRKVHKRYRLKYRGVLLPGAVESVKEGVLLPTETKKTLPAILSLENHPLGYATMILREGRNRQVRRMMLQQGGFVSFLHRDCIGGLVLPTEMKPGQYRELTEEDFALLSSQTIPPTAFDAQQMAVVEALGSATTAQVVESDEEDEHTEGEQGDKEAAEAAEGKIAGSDTGSDTGSDSEGDHETSKP
eukprot:TRINITY_DN11528_c0_g1_i1.p1 TRINITY_DN11528_c0_g1~~TRINITY_DN11528_c0_g1_i1.p1  ORF type:complete len:338 (-),score=63.76 TRINITY_DN11528_c0_g1_i1:85-1098(-)